MNPITWTAPANDPAEQIRGKTFSGGHPDKIAGGEIAVRFDGPLIEGKRLCAKISNRPELAALVATYDAARKAEQSTNEARWAAQRAEQDAIDKPLLAAMDIKAARLRSMVPVGSVEVVSKKTGEYDGSPIMDYTAEGVKICWKDIVVHGYACALRPGALDAFASLCIASIPRAKLEMIKRAREVAKAEKEAQAEKAQSDRAAKFAKAAATGKPVELRRWTETRRAREGGEWGDYLFICRELAMPDGTIKNSAINTY